MLAMVVVAGGGWALYQTFRNPWVPLEDPRVVVRVPRDPAERTVVLAGDLDRKSVV